MCDFKSASDCKIISIFGDVKVGHISDDAKIITDSREVKQ